MQDLAAELTFLFCYVEEGSFSARRSSEWHKPLACLLPGFRSPKVSFRALIPWRTWKLCTMALHNSLSLCQVMSTLCDPMDCSMPGFSILHCLLAFAQTLVHWVGDAIQPSHPLSLLSPPALNLSHHRCLFQWVSSSHQVAKYWNFSFSISSSSKYSGLISFRIDWFDVLAVRWTLKSSPAPQFESIGLSSALSLLYGPILTSVDDDWKNHTFNSMDLCRQSDVSAF